MKENILSALDQKFESARKINIYLAWQTIKDGRRQIRRYSPNAANSELKLFETASQKAIDWLEKANHPEFPYCVGKETTAPYHVAYIGKDTKGTV
jgi:hypothetical protein